MTLGNLLSVTWASTYIIIYDATGELESNYARSITNEYRDCRIVDIMVDCNEMHVTVAR